MRRILAIAVLSSSLIGLAACSGGSSSAIPAPTLTSSEAGVKGGLAKFDATQSHVEIQAGAKGGLAKFGGVKGGLAKFAGTKGGLAKFAGVKGGLQKF